jgi:outer membrane biosynthesis protein TonB
VLVIQFHIATNAPSCTGTGIAAVGCLVVNGSVVNSALTDKLFLFSDPIGADYSGEWATPSRFMVTTPNPIPNPRYTSDPTPTPTPTPTPAPTSAPAPTPAPAPAPTPAPTPTPAPAPTPTLPLTPAPTPAPAPTPTPTPIQVTILDPTGSDVVRGRTTVFVQGGIRNAAGDALSAD